MELSHRALTKGGNAKKTGVNKGKGRKVNKVRESYAGPNTLGLDLDSISSRTIDKSDRGTGLAVSCIGSTKHQARKSMGYSTISKIAKDQEKKTPSSKGYETYKRLTKTPTRAKNTKEANSKDSFKVQSKTKVCSTPKPSKLKSSTLKADTKKEPIISTPKSKKKVGSLIKSNTPQFAQNEKKKQEVNIEPKDFKDDETCSPLRSHKSISKNSEKSLEYQDSQEEKLSEIAEQPESQKEKEMIQIIEENAQLQDSFAHKEYSKGIII